MNKLTCKKCKETTYGYENIVKKFSKCSIVKSGFRGKCKECRRLQANGGRKGRKKYTFKNGPVTDEKISFDGVCGCGKQLRAGRGYGKTKVAICPDDSCNDIRSIMYMGKV